MFTLLSLVTSVKDYVEIVHKLIETDATQTLKSYYDLGAITTYIVVIAKQLFTDFISFQWLQNAASLPILVPSMAKSMISEISVLDGYFHNVLTFLETPLSYGNQNTFLYCLEKFSIGIINSFFLCLPTSTAHLICLRRFVMQGLEAGYIAGLGTIAGNMIWIGSVVFGLRFIVIPWLSFDLLRYFLGFMLLIKYMWDSYTEKKFVLDDISKSKIFLLNFLLAFTEQTNLYPFISNLSISSDSTILESFPATHFFEFLSIHGFYLLGILVGSLSLLQFTCWFWENPAFNIYMWLISSFKVTTNVYYQVVNFTFLYLTMICAMSSVAYFGLDYTLTNSLGFVHEDRLLDQKALLETAFLNTKASDRNTRRNRGRHGRRERWKRRVRRYRTFDISMYDQGVFDLFTIEDLNYGFDRFWLRRKMRNHGVRFRFFPGPWMRSFKKQLSKPRLESFMGPRMEFFRILFEQVYHPEFHKYSKKENKNLELTKKTTQTLNRNAIGLENSSLNAIALKTNPKLVSIYSDKGTKYVTNGLIKEYSALRKFLRKVDTRVQLSKIVDETQRNLRSANATNQTTNPIYSKRWKHLFSKLGHDLELKNRNVQQSLWKQFNSEILQKNSLKNNTTLFQFFERKNSLSNSNKEIYQTTTDAKNHSKKRMTKKERQILRYKTFLENLPSSSMISDSSRSKNHFNGLKIQTLSVNTELTPLSKTAISDSNNRPSQTQRSNFVKDSSSYKPLTLLHPLKFYLQKEKAFQRKFKFYGVNMFRNFEIGNNAPYFRIMMTRFFYHYKPTLRWERTMRTATLRKARRKGPRVVRKIRGQNSISGKRIDNNTKIIGNLNLPSEGLLNTNEIKDGEFNQLQKPTHFYSLVNKRANRYRYQIYRDVLQHWYYSPFNRLLLKFDVDSFIQRQPKAHCLTKKEEHLLHLRRFLLSEHYESLRWYTYMQHYRSMKTKIGGTKSFSSRIYNQQFQGTFKKIRHLFAITPSATENMVLKFDQPLYNEFENQNQSSILEDSLIHEELLADDIAYNASIFGLMSGDESNERKKGKVEANDLVNQSAQIVREYLNTANPMRKELILNLLKEKNYWQLSNFLFKGQKLRGTRPFTNQSSLLNQEQIYLSENGSSANEILKEDSNKIEADAFSEDLWIALIQKCQNLLYNQDSLKIYLSRHMEKHEREKQKQQKVLKLRLDRMKKWLLWQETLSENSDFNLKKLNLGNPSVLEKDATIQKEFIPNLKTSIQKAIRESIFVQQGITNPKIHVRNERAKTLLPALKRNSIISPTNHIEEIQNMKLHLANRTKLKVFQNLLIEKDLKQSFKGIKKKMQQNLGSQQTEVGQRYQKILKLTKTTFLPFIHISNWTRQNVLKPASMAFKNLFEVQSSSLKDWRKQEMMLTKRKKMRKKLDRLTNTKRTDEKNIPIDALVSYDVKLDGIKAIDFSSKNQSRQKLDFTETSSKVFMNLQNSKLPTSWDSYLSNIKKSGKLRDTNTNSSVDGSEKVRQILRPVSNFIDQDFKRKRSRARLKSSVKRRERIKKRTLADKLRRQFRLLKKYGQTIDRQNKKVEIFQLITKRKYDPNSPFEVREIKQQRTRQRKHRSWKTSKKPKYAQTRRKLRKRRRYAIGKIRNLNKKLKHIKNQLEIKQWWWQRFLPNFQAKTDAVLQIKKDLQLQKQISSLSANTILEDYPTKASVAGEKGVTQTTLQIGNKDYKPLMMPEALEIREKFIKTGKLTFNGQSLPVNTLEGNENNPVSSSDLETKKPTRNLTLGEDSNSAIFETPENRFSVIDKISQNLLVPQIGNLDSTNSNKFMVATNPIPFYAGWDETLRKFVVTNRLLSRNDASYQMVFGENLNSISNQGSKGSTPSNIGQNSILTNYPTLRNLKGKLETSKIEFTQAPLKGMNAATTLYWQIPFTTYDPDQFFALGMDGFSPVNWRRFNFKHSKFTTKPMLIKMQTLATKDFKESQFTDPSMTMSGNQFSYNIQKKLLHSEKPIERGSMKRMSHLNKIRRIQKRYKRVKKHPRPPVWFPSGSLANQVLPVHYIYVFYKRSRLPRDRYMSRHVRRNKDTIPMVIKDSLTKITDYTLRKRIKPKRKYHRKRIFRKTEDLLLRRRAFRGFITDKKRERPFSKTQLLSKSDVQNLKFKSKQRRKAKSNKQQADNIRIRQLRRRVQRQVLRPVWRYKPRAGGFIWPGDYLRLELVDAPKLNFGGTNPAISLNEPKSDVSRKVRKKKRKRLPEWQIQPKKYLLEKHNLKVLKNRLEKAQNGSKIQQQIKLNSLLNS